MQLLYNLMVTLCYSNFIAGVCFVVYKHLTKFSHSLFNITAYTMVVAF